VENPAAESIITSLGFPTETARIYLRIQPMSGRPIDEVAEVSGLTREELEEAVAELAAAGIVRLGEESIQVLTPAEAISRLIESAAETARGAHERLLSISRAVPYISARSAGVAPEHLEGSVQPIDGELFRSRYLPGTLAAIVQRTTGDLAWLRPDQWREPWEEDMNNLVAEVVASGRRARAIYPVRGLGEAPAVLQSRADVGEEIRLLPDLPTRLLVIGVTHALMPEPLGSAASPRIMVRQRGIVEAMGLLFEQLWERASPLAEYERDTTGEEVRRQLLAQLAAGSQDEQIARRLGVSLRTVRRRVAEVMAELGADSRFQAGVEAARRGWL